MTMLTIAEFDKQIEWQTWSYVGIRAQTPTQRAMSPRGLDAWEGILRRYPERLPAYRNQFRANPGSIHVLHAHVWLVNVIKAIEGNYGRSSAFRRAMAGAGEAAFKVAFELGGPQAVTALVTEALKKQR